MNRGTWYAVVAYVLWGFLPVYWKWLQAVPAPQLLSHRIVWSCVALTVVIAASGRWRAFLTTLRTPKTWYVYSVAAVLIGVNWLVYVWAVNSGHIIETSLGYFINPLISVLMGVLFLRERLRLAQWLAIALATIGVAYLTLNFGSLPWIALTLAVTWAVYGLIKKLAPLGSLEGLTLETGILFLPALVYLLYLEQMGSGMFLHTSFVTTALLAGAGLATTTPLLLFSAAAQRIPLSLVGLLQYIAPSIQFLLGLLVYHEPFTPERFIGFAIVWVALIVYGAESFRAARLKLVRIAVAED